MHLLDFVHISAALHILKSIIFTYCLLVFTYTYFFPVLLIREQQLQENGLSLFHA